MGFANNKEAGENCGVKTTQNVISAGEDLEDEEDLHRTLQLGPRSPLKQHLEKDEEDESLRRGKEKLLGSVDFDDIGEFLELEVKFLSMSTVSPCRPDVILPVPNSGNPNGLWFTLKEGSPYSLKFSFQVSNNLVSGLMYTNTVWKTGIKGDAWDL